jgi:hypothetical protein
MIIYTHPEPDKEVAEMKGPLTEDIEIQVRRRSLFAGRVVRYNIATQLLVLRESSII